MICSALKIKNPNDLNTKYGVARKETKKIKYYKFKKFRSETKIKEKVN